MTHKTFTASWIWLDPLRYPDHQSTPISKFDRNGYSGGMALFAREFTWQTATCGAIARVSGDCKYRIKINGVIVGDGPPEVGGDYNNTQAPDWWFFDTFDFSDLLKAGSNRIEAEVMLEGDCEADYSTGQGGFLFELCDKHGNVILKSDASWLCCLNSAWQPGSYDARLEPGDTEWENAVELPGQNWNLKELNIPPLRITEVFPTMDEALPYTIQPGIPKVIYLRFDQEMAAVFSMYVSGFSGAYITIFYGEHPGIYHQTEVYHLKNGKHKFRSTRMNAFKYIKLVVQCGGFDSSTYKPVELFELSAFSRGFPVTTLKTITSEVALDKTRKCCEMTLKMCMQRLHLDSPRHQEGLGCTGDYMIESLMGYYLFGEYRLAAADIKRTAYLLKQKQGIMFHTSYSLMWIEMVRDYLFYSGDFKLVREVFPQVKLLLTLFAGYLGKTGLVSEAPNYMFIDWINDGEFNYHHPPASRGMGAMTAWYYKALVTGAELARRCAEPDKLWIEQAAELQKSFHEQLWDMEAGFYQDGVVGLSKRNAADLFLPQEDGNTSFTMHTNILALALGLVPAELAADLQTRVMEYNWAVKPQPYFMHFVFEALYVNGGFEDYAAKLLAMWQPLVEEYPTGLKECWNCGDYSHAWGGTPAYQIGRSILGVSPLEPGFALVLIAPHIAGVQSIAGEVLTPRGLIRVAWRFINGVFELNVDLPMGTKYKLRLPDCLGDIKPLVKINFL